MDPPPAEPDQDKKEQPSPGISAAFPGVQRH
jgi:hypothetical protein